MASSRSIRTITPKTILNINTGYVYYDHNDKSPPHNAACFVNKKNRKPMIACCNKNRYKNLDSVEWEVP